MTVQELIDELNELEDKTLEVQIEVAHGKNRFRIDDVEFVQNEDKKLVLLWSETEV